MSGWPDLVTTALLGTDRRPVPADLALGWVTVDLSQAATDPTSYVLALAAAHRSVAQAGASLERCPAPPEAPTERLPLAPSRAQDLLAGLLVRPEPALVNAWLSSCAQRGLGVAVELWPRLANLAARSSAYDRTLLARTLGPRGRWFLAQNPQWVRVADAPAGRPATASSIEPAVALAFAEHGESPTVAMEMILACADPLSTQLVLAALRLVASGELGAGTRQAASALGHRIPLPGWSDLTEWAAQNGSGQPAPPAMARTVQFSLDLIVDAVRARIEIDDAFAATPQEETTP